MYFPFHIPGLTLPLPPASPQFINLYGETTAKQVPGAQQELTEGLTTASANVSPKFFYNALGSKLFEAITGLDEYYPTRTEAAIFATAYAQISETLADADIRSPCLIDLGAGNCGKAMALIPHLTPRQYVPVDISVDFLRESAEQVQNSFPVYVYDPTWDEYAVLFRHIPVAAVEAAFIRAVQTDLHLSPQSFAAIVAQQPAAPPPLGHAVEMVMES